MVSAYPDREEAIEALFSSAITEEEKLNNVKQAVTSYQMLVDKYPASKLAEKAKARIEKLTTKR